MMTVHTAGIHWPDRPVAHSFELAGWTTGVSGVAEVSVAIGGVDAELRPGPCPGAPEGALAWVARPRVPLPNGNHIAVVRGPDRSVALTQGAVTVGTLPGEGPLWAGEVELPGPDGVVPGRVVDVRGWALLDGRAPSLVEVLVEGGGSVRARTRLPRPDVAGALPGFDDAAISGFEARVPVDVLPGEERELALRVRFRTGDREHVAPTRRFVLRNPPADPAEAELAAELAADTARALARVSAVTDPRHVLVFTHSLGLGGGQLWLQELLSGLVGEHGWQVSLVTETDGALRADCAELGVPVHLTSHYRHSTVAHYEGHVSELARFAACSGAGVALVNTLGGFVAADAAKRAGLPTGWVIHESFALPDFAYQNWGPLGLPPAVWTRWESTLAEVDRLLFVADATREMFLPHSEPERCRTVRYGTPMWRLGGRTRPEVRAQARAALGFGDDDFALVSVGVVEPRKGHGPLIAAMERVLVRHPSARLSIVGGHASPYSEALGETIRRAGLSDSVHLVPIQRDPTPWLYSADVFVNGSDVESLPRSILEAVCCGVPVAATDVFGAREMVVDGVTGWLFEPNDVDALTVALLRALGSTAADRRSMARAAHAELAGWLDPAGYAREFSEILTELATGERTTTGGDLVR